MRETGNRNADQEQEKAVIYALGEYWKKYSERIQGMYEIIACSDRDGNAVEYAMGNPFVDPEQISALSYDKIILGCKRRGIRELLTLQYGLPADRIFYYDEIFGKYIPRRESNVIKHREHLTVVIPTYNRKQRLQRTLDILEIQSNNDFDIIVLDNCSNYNVEEITDGRESKFKGRIKVVHNKANIGMAANLANAFIQKMDGWVWMLSDDDIPSIYAVEDIYEEIERHGSSCTGIIHFSICDWSMYVGEDGKDFTTLHELMEFYGNITAGAGGENGCSGDFIYFSNKVYNMKYVQRYIEKIFFYAYSGVPQLVPVLFMLNEGTAGMRVSNKKIVMNDTAGGDHWDWLKTMLGMRIITDFPLCLDKDDRRMLYRIVMGNYIDEVINHVHESSMEFELMQIEKIYDEVYQYSLNDEERRACQIKIKKMKDRIRTK